MLEITDSGKQFFDEAEKEFYAIRRGFQDERAARNGAVCDVFDLMDDIESAQLARQGN